MKPKILFILHFPPPVHGAAMVGKYIMESEIVNSSFHTKYINLGTSRSVDEIGSGGIRKWIRYFQLLWKTFFIVLKFKPQLVYITLTAKGGGFYKDAIIALMVKAFRKKVVYHFHNKGVQDRQENFFDHRLYKAVFKNANVILLSKHLYSDVKKYVPVDKAYFCPNGIPEIVYNPEIRPEKEKINILFLSNLILAKGVFVLLEACKLLKDKKLNFNVTFIGAAGDISVTQFQSSINKHDLNTVVRYVGKKYGAEKDQFFQQADIFVFPSFNETFGLVNLEAMQHSLPVISTFEGGIPDVVENGITGFLVSQRDIHSLAEKLEILIKNPQLRTSMSAAGRKKYEKEFTLRAFETRFVSILKELV